MTPQESTRRVGEICRMAPVIPVLTIDDPATARPLAEALVRGGLPVLEVTLRTEAALAAIAAMAEVAGAVVGAGTLLTDADVRHAREAGARFGVSPGATPRLLEACETEGLPFLPGAATASEAMCLLERGYAIQKFFPAETAGGVRTLKSLGAPLPQVAFCPTGGIDLAKAADYLALANVICCGGSWLAPPDLVTAGEWARIEDLAREAAALASPAG